MEEIWKDIKGYEGLYQVSNLGRVKSLGNCKIKNQYSGKERILKEYTNKYGYNCVVLSKDGVHKCCTVHRLVAVEFVPNDDPINKDQVNHKDESKTNNNSDNLEWCTIEYNNNYGTRKFKTSDKVRNHPNISKKVLQYSTDGEFIKEWPSTMEIQRTLGFNNSSISSCCLGKTQQSYGYIWKYAA